MPSVTKSKLPAMSYHIAQHPELYTPARSNNFTFFVKFPEKLLRAGVDASPEEEINYIDGAIAQEVLQLSVDESAVPHAKQNVIEENIWNTTVKFAGKWTYDAGSFVFKDFIGADTKSILYAWRRLSMGETTGAVGDAADYKLTARLVEYTPDGKEIREWDYYGVWISDISEEAFQMDNDGKRKITATIEYDRALPHLPSDNIIVPFVKGL